MPGRLIGGVAPGAEFAPDQGIDEEQIMIREKALRLSFAVHGATATPSDTTR